MADDYTPSVDEARARYVDVCRDTDQCHLCDEVGAEFDRMIDAVRAEEREQADREPSDAEVDAAGEAIWGRGWRVPKEVVRAALIAAQEVRRGD